MIRHQEGFRLAISRIAGVSIADENSFPQRDATGNGVMKFREDLDMSNVLRGTRGSVG